MAGSRRFLLFLVLVCISGVILVQVSMDSKEPEPSLLINDIPPFRELKTDRMNISETEFKIATKTTIRLPSTSARLLKKFDTTRTVLLEKRTSPTIRTPKTQQVTPGRKSQNKYFVNRQDRVAEILNQGASIQKKVALDPMRSLRSIPVVDPRKVKRIVLITYFRAGSSFIGDILQQNWRTFYHFEPLHSLTYDRRIEDGQVPEVFGLFNDIFRCNFDDQKNYIDWVRQPRNQFLFAHNLFLWVTCHGNPKSCFNSTFINSVCKRAPYHVMKITRLHMRHLSSFLKDNSDLNLKVAFLTRDPRGIVSSRWSLDWCRGTNCSDAGTLCREMEEDIRIFDRLQTQQPQNFIKVRYEDLSLTPENETKKLFEFLDLPYSVSIKKFLKTHTVGRKNDDKNPYSTRRNSTMMVSSWRERFSYKQVAQVQSQCEKVLLKLNHTFITSPSELPYPDGRITTKKPTDLLSSQMKRFHNNPLAKKYFAQKNLDKTKKETFTKNSTSHSSNKKNIDIHKSNNIINL